MLINIFEKMLLIHMFYQLIFQQQIFKTFISNFIWQCAQVSVYE